MPARLPGRRTGRPASPDVKYFQRQLNEADKQILLAAGEGDISAGFHEVMDVYQHFYNLGLRPYTAIKDVQLVLPSTQD